MSDAGQYLIWLPVVAAIIGGVIGGRGSLKCGLRLALIAYASCAVAFQHVEFAQPMLQALFHIDVLPYDAVIGGLSVVAFAIWEAAYQLLWRPTPATGNGVRRTGGLILGASAGWVIGTALIAGLIALRVVDGANLTEYPSYLNMLKDMLDTMHRIVMPLIP